MGLLDAVDPRKQSKNITSALSGDISGLASSATNITFPGAQQLTPSSLNPINLLKPNTGKKIKAIKKKLTQELIRERMARREKIPPLPDIEEKRRRARRAVAMRMAARSGRASTVLSQGDTLG